MAERMPATTEDLAQLKKRGEVPALQPDEKQKYRDEKDAWHRSGCLPGRPSDEDYERFLKTVAQMSFPDDKIGETQRHVYFDRINQAFEAGILPAWVRSRAMVLLRINGHEVATSDLDQSERDSE